MMPSAPGLVSMITGWPRACCSGVEKMRAPTSAAPPGGNGTTSRIGLSGYCALTEKAASVAAMKTNRRMDNSSSFEILLRELAHHGGERAVRRGELLEHGEVIVPARLERL